MYNYSATIIRWIDGDTVDMRVDLGFRMFAETRFRLYGINTPEHGQPNFHEATTFANTMAPVGATVQVSTYKEPEKYGRWLAEILTVDGKDVNQALITAGLAVPYFGGTK